jgi:acetyl esterase
LGVKPCPVCLYPQGIVFHSDGRSSGAAGLFLVLVKEMATTFVKPLFTPLLILSFVTLTFLAGESRGQQPRPATAGKPDPDLANVRYGPHERNVLDLWKAPSKQPTPLVVYIHGGGFRAGDKGSVSPLLLRECLRRGISVAALNYRLSQQAPFPAPMLDGARAIQFLRSKASDWHLDPKRIAATGASAGAGISLWVGFHDDLADSKGKDPVARESSRLTCMAVLGAQTSYDPRFIQKHIGGRAHEHPALLPFYGLSKEEIDTPKAHKLYEQASPINLVSKDDPPVFLFYAEPKGPLPEDARPGQGIHHINFGLELKKKMDPLKIRCIVRHRDDYRDRPGRGPIQQQLYADLLRFFARNFNLPRQGARSRPGRRPGERITPPARGERHSTKLGVGDEAPDFTLPTLAGDREVTLSSFQGHKPVILIFASYT